jgi:hypothetical protein
MAGYIGSKASVVSSGAERKKVFDITTTTTSLTGCSYTPNQVHVYHNGVRLVDGTDYTATDGSTVTLTTAAQSGDEVVVISYATFQTSDTVSASAGGTFSNAVTIDADGATVLTVDRATSYGPIIELQRNGSTVGEIGVAEFSGASVGRPFFTNHSEEGLGIHYIGTANAAIVPIRNNEEVDDAGYLGYTNHRWKDLYLSGGVYLGGTGSANYLADYETGTWTPEVADVGAGESYNAGTYSSGTNTYVKIGNVVHLFFELNNIDTTGMTGSNDIFIRNVPFTSHSSNGTNYYGTVRTSAVSYQTDANIALQMNNNDSHFRVVESRNGLTADFILVSQVTSGGGDIHGTLTYETDS